MAVVVLLWPLTTWAGYFRTGNELLEHCEKNSEKEPVISMLCITYLQGVVDSLDSSDHVALLQLAPKDLKKEHKAMLDTMISGSFCIPGGVTPKQLRLVFLNWAREHPAELHSNASKLVRKAFTEAWPCG